MGRRLIIERIDEGSPPPLDHQRGVDAPVVTDIRIVFGVGRRAKAAPTNDDFSPVYTVSVPVFSLTGLDSDGVHEFDAARTLEDLQSRAQRRAWAARLELVFTQDAATVNAADLYIDSPYPDDGGPEIFVAGAGGRGSTTLGGAREVVIATSLAHNADEVQALGGKFLVQLRDADPRSEQRAGVESPARSVELNLTRYEFQG